MEPIKIYRGRDVVVPVHLPWDVSTDEISSQIRTDTDPESELIATWNVAFETDGTDGEVILSLDDSVTSLITRHRGYMDMKWVRDGDVFQAFDDPLDVVILDPVTE